MVSINGYKGETPGVQHNFGPPNTDAAARQATEEQVSGDEFKAYKNPDIEGLIAELNKLEVEQTNLCAELYGPPNWYQTHKTGYKGPPYLERERVSRELQEVEQEMGSIKAQLRTYLDALGTNTDSDENESPTGPFTGNAVVIGG